MRPDITCFSPNDAVDGGSLTLRFAPQLLAKRSREAVNAIANRRFRKARKTEDKRLASRRTGVIACKSRGCYARVVGKPGCLRIGHASLESCRKIGYEVHATGRGCELKQPLKPSAGFQQNGHPLRVDPACSADVGCVSAAVDQIRQDGLAHDGCQWLVVP